MKYLGLDYGDKRIGIAVATGGFGQAEGVATLASLDEVIDYIQDHGPFEAIVMGLPRNTDGDDTAQTLRAREAGAELTNRLGQTIELIDEFDTSNVARQRLAGRKKNFRPEDIDAEAAAIILDDYLAEQD